MWIEFLGFGNGGTMSGTKLSDKDYSILVYCRQQHVKPHDKEFYKNVHHIVPEKEIKRKEVK